MPIPHPSRIRLYRAGAYWAALSLDYRTSTQGASRKEALGFLPLVLPAKRKRSWLKRRVPVYEARRRFARPTAPPPTA